MLLFLSCDKTLKLENVLDIFVPTEVKSGRGEGGENSSGDSQRQVLK